ncbi:GHMP kinase, N-terminal domain protein [uncultured Desulfobacterium sp.]|uniref:GHMP kinase, N-terminal domain protein n=1 Tax=uncultured Desulfobacterium sp. TaxID=201089 RepID=A0A445MVM6_9BACT|nr:GHMP kinase, N-terminal domain protein [uncultured Desulfobacterium sp.]
MKSNIQMPLSSILAKQPIEASAPCRVDSGGTWDIKAMSLPLEAERPTTVNVALNLRTHVALSPYKEGWVKISSDGFRKTEECYRDRLFFDSIFGLFFAAISHFGFHGLKVNIRSESPVKSALGGSSTALVALLQALNKASALVGGRRLSKKDLLHLGYHLEDGIAGGNCGLQDQAAAVYGGVNQWLWQYGDRAGAFKRVPLLDRKGQKALSDCILVAYSGTSHVSSRINRNWITQFLSGKTRQGWIRVNKIIHELAAAVKDQNWTRAAGLVQEEMAIRKKITPEALVPVTLRLIREAERQGCGARFAGAGAGGSLWAIGDKKDIQRLRERWAYSLSTVKGARLLDCQVDPVGIR